MNYALSAASCVLRIWHSIKHKESVEDFARLFICSKASPNALTRINSPPLRFAYTRHPLPGVDISKLESVVAVLWLLVIKIGDFSNKVKKQIRFLCKAGQRYDRRKAANTALHRKFNTIF